MTRRHNMPEIDIASLGLDGRDAEIAGGILNKGKLRATKPKKDGESAYVWRMVAFMVSPKREHMCMPVTAEFDLPDSYWSGGRDESDDEKRARHERRRARVNELQAIADKIVDLVPVESRHGVNRWGRAFGVL